MGRKKKVTPAVARQQLEAQRRMQVRAAGTPAQARRAEAEHKQRRTEQMNAYADGLNAQVAALTGSIDSMLAVSLRRDHSVDLESMRKGVRLPPFSRPDLVDPLPDPVPVTVGEEPVWVEPARSAGMVGSIRGGSGHEAKRARRWRKHCEAHEAWQHATAQAPVLQLQQLQAHQQAEERRQRALSAAQEQHQAECEERQKATDTYNDWVDRMLVGLEAGVPGAVENYLSLVADNSSYPKAFPVRQERRFDGALSELALEVTVPKPDTMPNVREYRYVASTDEVQPVHLSQKERKDSYASAVFQVAIRSMHEAFAADRWGCIQSISLRVGVDVLNPATGLPARLEFVAGAVPRETFTSFALANVVPVATLQHLGALVSSDPFGLVGVDTSHGVRTV